MAKKAEAKTSVTDTETVVIKLPRYPGAEDPVFVRVNDYTCTIKRGVNVEVPDYVAAVLENQEHMLDMAAKAEEAAAYQE